jgi:hypothetical protein
MLPPALGDSGFGPFGVGSALAREGEGRGVEEAPELEAEEGGREGGREGGGEGLVQRRPA